MYTAKDYVIGESSVMLHGTPVRGAKSSSFRHLFGYWSRDDRSVYWSVFKRTKINAESFEPLNNIWGRDVKSAYPSSGTPLSGVNLNKFRVFDTGEFSDGAPSLLPPDLVGYAGDDRRVFFHNSTYPSAWEVKKADAASFISMGGRYARDNNTVFYEQRTVKQANPRSFRLVGLCGYAADEDHVFFNGKDVAGADPASFVILWCSTLHAARDRHRYYYRGQPMDVSEYIKLLDHDAKRRKEHIAEVRNGLFDKHYRECMVDYHQ